LLYALPQPEHHSTNGMTIVHVVSQTHWDREWYEPLARFRQRLVALIDELLAAPPAGGASFLLDGQVVVLEDYLEVRPQRRSELAALLQAGALEAGPWFVLADELMPSGESLVRNLFAGRRALRDLGAAPPSVLYCPDSFGHPAALPTLARGFGCATVIVWRGYGGARWPAGDAAWWTAPNGDRVLLHHLSKSGYELGANLPSEAADSRMRWKAIRAELIPRNRLGTTLLLNGADHHARQSLLGGALSALALSALPDEIRVSSLAAFASDAGRRAEAAEPPLPVVRGELRDSYGFTWTLQGTFATRAAQKRRHAQVERLLLRDVEPWVAFAARTGTATTSRRQLVDAAWRSVLLCQPHDTMCGVSVDEVARAMDARLDDAESQAHGLRADALADLIGHDPELARESHDEWQPIVVVRNRAARPRRGAAMLELSAFLAHVKVGPGSAAPSPAAPERVAPAMPGIRSVQLLSREVRHERTESPRHYPDDDLVTRSSVMAWVDEIPAYGIRCFAPVSRKRRGSIPNPAQVSGRALMNGLVSVQVTGEGRVAVHDLRSGRIVEELLEWESLTDAGDLYTPSVRDVKLVPTLRRVRVLHRGPVRAALAMDWSFRSGRERVDTRVQLIVDADAPWVRVHIEGTNAASDHRLRVHLGTDVTQPLVAADAMFGPVDRRPLVIPVEEARIEQPQRSAPLHRYVSLFNARCGASVFSDGLAEYEVSDGGGVFVTLLRAVGELSRVDLPERPGHAGWPTATPKAESAGAFAAELALLLHGPRSDVTTGEIERAADDILLPLCGATLRSALRQPPPFLGVELEGDGLAFSAAKESEDGEWLVLRCVNHAGEERAGSWRTNPAVGEAWLARLDETRLSPAAVRDGKIPFVAPAHGVVTMLVRQASP
jgi:mannosylglycerate hydrolase